MKVTLIAKTELTGHDDDYMFEYAHRAIEQWMSFEGDTHADTLAEFAGRACYLSFHRPNVRTRKNADYIANIVKQQHFSVLEHASATFYIEDVSRSLTHELVRHRHLSFSQQSQRYVNQDDNATVIPPIMKNVEDFPCDFGLDIMADAAVRSLESYKALYDLLCLRGHDHKSARGAARAVLLESTSTSIVVTGNHRAWRDFLSKRLSPSADQEIRQLAQTLLHELHSIAPATYKDFEEYI